MNTIGLPVVRMCGNPYCGGWGSCREIRNDRRTMGLRDWLRADAREPEVLRSFLQEIAMAKPSDSQGVHYMVPDGCEFTVHKGHEGLPFDEVWRHVPAFEGYTAIYSGPDADLDEILHAAPEWSEELMMARLNSIPPLEVAA